MQSDFVYVFSNPGLTSYKIGMTTRPLYLRQGELMREYGTLYPFEIASRHAVDNPGAVEALAHRILDRCRVPRSELFACSLGECQKAILAAAKLVLDRPWYSRLWHTLTLPRPAPNRRHGYRRASSTGSVLFLLTVSLLAALLIQFRPELPAWFPSSVIRAAYLLERFRR